MLSRQVGSDGVGGVAVQAVAGMVVAAGRAGIFVAGVVLHVAQGGAGVRYWWVAAEWRSWWRSSPAYSSRRTRARS